jgi:hypothetical protein
VNRLTVLKKNPLLALGQKGRSKKGKRRVYFFVKFTATP